MRWTSLILSVLAVPVALSTPVHAIPIGSTTDSKVNGSLMDKFKQAFKGNEGPSACLRPPSIMSMIEPKCYSSLPNSDSNIATKAASDELSPITHLPADLLGEIFFHVVFNAPAIDISRGLALIDKLPWSLAHVCFAWKTAVYSEPRIWRDIMVITKGPWVELYSKKLHDAFPFGISSIASPSHELRMLNTHHASSLLRNLRILCVRGSMESMIDMDLHCSELLASLEVLKLGITSGWQSYMVQPTLFGTMQNLSALSLRDSGGLDKLLLMLDVPWERLTTLDVGIISKVSETLLNTLLKCTHLNHLSYDYRDDPLNGPLPSLNSKSFLSSLSSLSMRHTMLPDLLSSCSRLKTLQLSSSDLHAVMTRVLPHVPNIELLTLSSEVGCIYFEQDVQTIIRLDHLQILTTVSPRSIVFLKYVVTPRLTHLHFEYEMPNGLWIDSKILPITEILGLLQRSNTTLVSFHYGYPVHIEQDIILLRFLRALPRLQEFVTPLLQFSESSLVEMNKKSLLPNLRTLTIGVTSPQAFADFVDDRMKAELRDEGFIRLKTACAYYQPPSGEAISLITYHESLERLQMLNLKHGTSFRLLLDQTSRKGTGAELMSRNTVTPRIDLVHFGEGWLAAEPEKLGPTSQVSAHARQDRVSNNKRNIVTATGGKSKVHTIRLSGEGNAAGFTCLLIDERTVLSALLLRGTPQEGWGAGRFQQRTSLKHAESDFSKSPLRSRSSSESMD
ncbi:hypothetical protein H0H93_008769 [Arthromyces matolae]|nr:hypothetical protein H0H93_008769 [Arthromyces matolae]